MLSEPQRLITSVTGAIFAGGASRRMGQPKEGVQLWDKRPMIAHVMDALMPVCQQIVIIGHCFGYEVSHDPMTGPQVIQIPDRYPGLGPMAALDALLSSGLSNSYLVASCDQPLLKPELLKLLLAQTNGAHPSFFQAQDGTALDPFPGLYPAALLPLVQKALADEQYALRPMLRQVPIHWVTLPKNQEVCLSNINTQDALAILNQTQAFLQEPAV